MLWHLHMLDKYKSWATEQTHTVSRAINKQAITHLKVNDFKMFNDNSTSEFQPKLEILKNSFSSVQSVSHVWLFATPWIAAHQASLSITNSRSLRKLMSIKSLMPSSHPILCCPLLLLPPIPPSIRVFSNESTLRTRWPKYWSFSFSVSPSNEHPGLIFRMDWMDLLVVQGTLKSLLQQTQFKSINSLDIYKFFKWS